MMSAENELATIYEILSEKVGNGNLPRNLTQFKIEMEKMIMPKYTDTDCRENMYKETISYLQNVLEVKNREIKGLILEVKSKNQYIVELQNRVDEITLNHKKYQKKIEDLEQFNEDKEVSEFTDRIMEDAERDIEDYKKEADTNKFVANNQSLIIRHFIMENIRNAGKDDYEFCEDGIDCSRISHLGHIIQSEIENMNDEDWNGDNKQSYLIYEGDEIHFRHTDMDDAESSSDDDD